MGLPIKLFQLVDRKFMCGVAAMQAVLFGFLSKQSKVLVIQYFFLIKFFGRKQNKYVWHLCGVHDNHSLQNIKKRHWLVKQTKTQKKKKSETAEWTCRVWRFISSCGVMQASHFGKTFLLDLKQSINQSINQSMVRNVDTNNTMDIVGRWNFTHDFVSKGCLFATQSKLLEKFFEFCLLFTFLQQHPRLKPLHHAVLQKVGSLPGTSAAKHYSAG